MVDDEAIPVMPVLAYANPKGGQPLDGRLRVEQQGNKIIVTDPRSAATWSTLFGLLGLSVIAISLIWGLLSVGTFLVHQADLPDESQAEGAILSSACGLIIMWRAAVAKQKPRVVEVIDGMVSTTGITTHGWIHRRLKPRRFLAIGGAPDLLTLKRSYSVHISSGLGFSCLLLPDLSKDEAIWIADVLNVALTCDQHSENNNGPNGD